MIGPAVGTRIFLACGHTDMRRGMDGLAALVQQAFGQDPFCGAVYLFRGKRGRLIKCVWHDGQGIPRQSGCDKRVNQDEIARLDFGMIVAISGFCNA